MPCIVDSQGWLLVLRGGRLGPPTGRSGLLGVKGGLLLRVRERPGGLPATLLPEHEAELLRRPQPLRMVGAERRAGLVQRQRAEHVLAKEAVLAADLLDLPDRQTRAPLVHQSVTTTAQVERAERRRSRGSGQEFPHRAGFSS